jgi:hypothetical protein
MFARRAGCRSSVGGFVSIRHKWLKVALMLMMVGGSLAGPMNPKEIEQQLKIMNENKIVISAPNETGAGGSDDNSDDNLH